MCCVGGCYRGCELDSELGISCHVGIPGPAGIFFVGVESTLKRIAESNLETLMTLVFIAAVPSNEYRE